MGDKMETFSARLASFDSVLPSINSRTSAARQIRPLVWPYDSPSPEQLAHAGFFFNPYDTNPDNTTCFMCRRALDGWEEGDNPVTEHLKHSPDCGWAVIMDIQQKTSNPAEIQDPTSIPIVEARKATFAIGWPHDGKPGWVCQSDKMVEAGWYFCPSEDSPDLASCPYCKLSLDGWEETDNPFEEHHRRSSECSFFTFALPAAKTTKKTTRAKKSRASKASRLSTQSVMTTTSEAPTIDEDPMDISVMSQSTAKKAKSTKKTTRSRSKKSKKEEPLEVDELMEPDPIEEQAPEAEPKRPKRATRGTKRGSEAVTQHLPAGYSADELDPAPDLEEPSPKRRATDIRRSISQQPDDMQTDYAEEAPVDVATSPVMPKKGRKGAKKSTATKTRKASTASSGRTTKGKVPDDSVLEAAIEADLTRNMQESEPFEFQYKDEERESARSRQQSIAASTEVPPATHNDIEESQDPQAEVEATEQIPVFEPEAEIVEEAASEPKAKKSSKRKATSKKSKKEKAHVQSESEPAPDQEIEPANEPEPIVVANPESDLTTRPKSSEPQAQPVDKELPEESIESEPISRHGSVVAVQIGTSEHQPESDSENMRLPAKKQGRKPGSKGKKAVKQVEDDLGDRNEATDTVSQGASPVLAPQRNSVSRHKVKDDEAVMVVGQARLSEGPAHEEVIAQQPVKAKRGRPPKDTEQSTQSEKQVVTKKPKRGRPSKQVPRKGETQLVHELETQSSQAPSSPVSKLPPKNTQRYSDLPKDRHRAQSFIESVAHETSSPQSRAQDTPNPKTQERTPSPSPQSSDAENRPPSTRPRSARPLIVSPSKTLSARVHLAASTPTKSPSKRLPDTGYLSSANSWEPADLDELFGGLGDKENRDFTFNHGNLKEILTSPERNMTVEEWIRFNAKNGEQRLRQECERLISIFEREGGRAMRALEGIECID